MGMGHETVQQVYDYDGRDAEFNFIFKSNSISNCM